MEDLLTVCFFNSVKCVFLCAETPLITTGFLIFQRHRSFDQILALLSIVMFISFKSALFLSNYEFGR